MFLTELTIAYALLQLIRECFVNVGVEIARNQLQNTPLLTVHSLSMREKRRWVETWAGPVKPMIHILCSKVRLDSPAEQAATGNMRLREKPLM